jgi:RNA polymerase sigma-70 factor (ECF subfamily)
VGSEHLDQRLSGITTVWTVLREAHAEPGETARAAQELLARRYGGAVYRYLLRALGDAAAAEDLAQEFALGLVRGDFRHADPGRGRFRNYLKAALFHLVGKYRKAQQKLPRPVAPADVDPPDANAAGDPAFDGDWSNELLARTWDTLAEAHPALYAALRLRASRPELSSPQLSAALTEQLGKPVTPEAARQLVHRARTRFADFLIDEVAHSLESPSADDLAEELRDLNLLTYCRPALERYRGGG